MPTFAELDSRSLIDAALTPANTNRYFQPTTSNTRSLVVKQKRDRSVQKTQNDSKRSIFYQTDSEDDTGENFATNLAVKGMTSSFSSIEQTSNNNEVLLAKTLKASIKSPNILLTKKKAPSSKIPRSFREAGPADRMLWKMKNNGKPWNEISKKWEEITNVKLARSSLSVRWMKLCTNFAESGGIDDVLLIKYKNEAQAELESTLWNLVVDKFKANTDVDYNADVLRKKYNALKVNDWGLIGNSFSDQDSKALSMDTDYDASSEDGNTAA